MKMAKNMHNKMAFFSWKLVQKTTLKKNQIKQWKNYTNNF